MSEPIEADLAAAPKAASRLAASSALYTVAYVFGNVGYFASVLLLAHWFLPSDRAFVAFATLSILLLARISRLGVPEASSVYAASEPELRPALLGSQLAWSLAAGTAVAAVFIAALRASGSHPAGVNASTLEVVGVGAVLYALYDSVGSFLVGSGRSRTYALTYPIEGWGWALAIIAVRLTSHLDPERAVIGWVAAIGIGGVVRVAAAARAEGVAPPTARQLTRMLRFGFPAWVGAISTFVSYRLDQVLMGFISTRRQLGLYAVGVNGSEVLLYVAMATSIALTPAIARSDPEEIAGRALRACRTVTVLTIACSAIGLAAGPFVLPIVFGRHNSGAVVPFMILAGSAVAWTTSVVLSSALFGAKATKLSALGSVTALLVGVAFDIALIPPYGAIGAAIATAAGFAGAGLAAMIAFRHRFGTAPSEFLPGREDVKALAGFARSGLREVARRANRG